MIARGGSVPAELAATTPIGDFAPESRRNPVNASQIRAVVDRPPRLLPHEEIVQKSFWWLYLLALLLGLLAVLAHLWKRRQERDRRQQQQLAG
jgi:hypothetical protein